MVEPLYMMRVNPEGNALVLHFTTLMAQFRLVLETNHQTLWLLVIKCLMLKLIHLQLSKTPHSSLQIYIMLDKGPLVDSSFHFLQRCLIGVQSGLWLVPWRTFTDILSTLDQVITLKEISVIFSIQLSLNCDYTPGHVMSNAWFASAITLEIKTKRVLVSSNQRILFLSPSVF